MINGEKDWKEEFGFEMFQVCVKAVEMKGIESAFGKVPIKEEESLVGNKGGMDVM